MRLPAIAIALALPALLSACGAVGVVQSSIHAHTFCPITDYRTPIWSADSTTIYFVSVPGDPRSLPELHAARADGLGDSLLARPAEDPVLSPDGKWIVYRYQHTGSQSFDFYVVDSQGGHARKIVEYAYDVPTWSPDSQTLAFSSAPMMPTNIFTINVVTGERADLTPPHDTPYLDGRPLWSPNGKLIAFTRADEDKSYLYVMGSDGSGLTRLTESPASCCAPICGDAIQEWLDDGSGIVYEHGCSPNRVTLAISVKGDEIPAARIVIAPTPSPGVSPDGRLIGYVGQDAQSYPTLFASFADGSQIVQLTRNPANGICLH